MYSNHMGCNAPAQYSNIHAHSLHLVDFVPSWQAIYTTPPRDRHPPSTGTRDPPRLFLLINFNA